MDAWCLYVIDMLIAMQKQMPLYILTTVTLKLGRIFLLESS